MNIMVYLSIVTGDIILGDFVNRLNHQVFSLIDDEPQINNRDNNFDIKNFFLPRYHLKNTII